MCVTFISAPTVVAPSGSASATAVIAALSMSATIAGVAKTSRSPDPIVAAVLPTVTVAVRRAANPFFSSIGHFVQFVETKNRYLCKGMNFRGL